MNSSLEVADIFKGDLDELVLLHDNIERCKIIESESFEDWQCKIDKHIHKYVDKQEQIFKKILEYANKEEA
jgi:uncharacterized HAD superfamily protein